MDVLFARKCRRGCSTRVALRGSKAWMSAVFVELSRGEGPDADAMSYVTVFEITHKAIPLIVPLSLLLFIIFVTLIVLDTRHWGFLAKFVRYPLILFFTCLFVVPSAYSLFDLRHSIQRYRDGKYKVVEGPVEHYSWRGKTECFTVNGVQFCHGTANQVGWKPPLGLGPSSWAVGILQDGLLVRVAYSDDPVAFEEKAFPFIFRLDVGSKSR